MAINSDHPEQLEGQWTVHEVLSQLEPQGASVTGSTNTYRPHHPRENHLLCNCSYILCTFPGYTEAASIIFTTHGLASWKSLGLLSRGMLRVSQAKVELEFELYRGGTLSCLLLYLYCQAHS